MFFLLYLRLIDFLSARDMNFKPLLEINIKIVKSFMKKISYNEWLISIAQLHSFKTSSFHAWDLLEVTMLRTLNANYISAGFVK